MNKFLLFFTLFAVNYSFAQPVVLSSWAPDAGDEWKQSITNETFDTRPTGANQIWDFSAATLVPGGSLAFQFIEVESGLNSDCYPDATVCADLVLEGFGSGFAYGYYQLDSEGFSALGETSTQSTLLHNDLFGEGVQGIESFKCVEYCTGLQVDSCTRSYSIKTTDFS